VAVKTVFLDVGETLVNEDRYWRKVAALAGVEPHVILAALGVTIACGGEHTDLWSRLGLDRPAGLGDVVYELQDLYPDALPCLEELRERGLRVGLAGNQSDALERWTRDSGFPVDFVGSSASWAVRKPDPRFFELVVELAGCLPGEVAYVGDRVDNDVRPAASAGLVAVHLRRGPWGRLQLTPPEATLGLDDLASLPEALASLA
jgi:FMN phosphatase YigB (HAD superfamily)